MWIHFLPTFHLKKPLRFEFKELLSIATKKWLEHCREDFKPVYYRRYVDDIFVLFRSCDHLIKFRDYLNKCHCNIKFYLEEEKN